MASGDLASTTKTLEEDTKYLSDLTAECEGKSGDFEQRKTTRQGEIEAIQKAIEIMSSDDVAGGTAHTGLVQLKATTSLAQLRSSSQSPALRIAAKLLKDRARLTNSRVLSLIALKVEDSPLQ